MVESRRWETYTLANEVFGEISSEHIGSQTLLHVLGEDLRGFVLNHTSASMNRSKSFETTYLQS